MAFRDFSLYSTIADFAALAPRISGTISAISSSTIIFLIFRSQPRLSTIYHRIMFGMSFADIMASTAMSLTTLPMPRNDDPVWNRKDYGSYNGETFWSDQTKIGNEQTCTVQGFFFSTGISIMFAYNGMLCFYYACAIAFRMHEKDIRKKVEPFLHGVPLVLGLCPAIPAFMYHFYTPITNDAWCTMRVKHVDTAPVSMFIFRYLPASIGGLVVLIVISLCLVIWRVRKNGKLLKEMVDHNDIQVEERVTAAHQNTKLIIFQSLAYIGALLVTLAFPLVRIMMGVDGYWNFTDKEAAVYVLMGKFMVVLVPLQGFFNLIIFLWHKGKGNRAKT
mmetsp:Transcript_26409/g.39120  ORF Transcript_26409/g.39120 Transcript_26409/m.39120 type:complete len:333 (+) Transcript_26409:69-1067(+)